MNNNNPLDEARDWCAEEGQPAPEPKLAVTELWVWIDEEDDSVHIIPATPAQVRAEYERLCPAEVKRAKVEKAFLHAAITDNRGREQDYHTGYQWYRIVYNIMRRSGAFENDGLVMAVAAMAAVLGAAKDAADE